MKRPYSRFMPGIGPILLGLAISCSHPDEALQPVDFDSEALYERLEPLGRAIGDSRIVLLGENGHGVGSFTRAKVRLVEWLYEVHDFEMIVFESGFFECGHVWARYDALTPEEALLQCLSYPFQHAEMVPLFELVEQRRTADRPLALAGMDIQAQGFDSAHRPAVLHEALTAVDAGLRRSS